MEWISYKTKDDTSYVKEYELDEVATTYKDLKYGSKSDKQALNLYIPHVKQESYPLIIYIHGGGYIQGDKTRHLMPMLQGLRYGYAVAAVNYRLVDEAVYPSMLYDVTTAIRFLKANASQYNLNPSKFIVWGETHGAFLACQIGICGAKGTVDDLSAGYEDYDSSVAGVIDYWAFTSFEELYNFATIVNKDKENPRYLEEYQFQAKGEDLLNIIRNTAHPLEEIDGSEPPFYVLHGEEDDSVPLMCSMSYYYALKAAKNDVTLEILPKTGHGLGKIVEARQIEGTYQFIHRIFDK